MKLRPKNLLITPEARILSASDSEVHLAVDGLVCGICAGRVQSALADLPGVESAECSLETGEAHVRLNAASDADWLAAVESTVLLPRGRRWLTKLSRLSRLAGA